jgi:hypothetical protein
MVGGLRAGPGRSHATRSGQTGSAPACLAPRLLQTTTHVAWELGFLSESEAGGKTGGSLSGKRAIPSDWQGICLLTQAEPERLLRTARDCQGKRRRPFADLCLTAWLRRREKRNLATHYAFGKSWSSNRLTRMTRDGKNAGRSRWSCCGASGMTTRSNGSTSSGCEFSYETVKKRWGGGRLPHSVVRRLGPRASSGALHHPGGVLDLAQVPAHARPDDAVRREKSVP